VAVFVQYRFKRASVFVALLIAGFVVYLLMFGIQGIYDRISDGGLFVAAVCAGFVGLTGLMYVMTRRAVDRRDF
jgi:hydrogenase-4 membrane subunit HyfE